MDEIVTRSASIRSVSAYLLRFDDPAPGFVAHGMAEFEAAPVEAFDPETPLFEFAELEPEPDPEPEPAAVDIDALRRAFEEEREAALQTQQAAHEEALRLARAQWAETQANVLSERMAESLATAFEQLRSDVARILAPFVAREIEELACEDLIEATRRALADEQAPAIRVEGPKDLIERLSQTLGSVQASVSLIETEGVDVQIDLAHARLETRLDAWMRRLSESRSGVA